MVYQTMQKMDLDAANIFASVHLPDQPPDKSVRRDNSTQRRFWDAARKLVQIQISDFMSEEMYLHFVVKL